MGKREITPEARMSDLVTQELQDELLVYDQNRHKAHCLNSTAALIWKHCDGQTSVSEMAGKLQHETQVTVDEEVVWLGLKQLADCHLLQGRLTPPGGKTAIPRREAVRRIGLASALAIPVIMSITAPEAHAQASCLARGFACTSNTQCCSGNCRGNGTCA
jgi:Coenzyme PQQ synthesis protein D (PqqD)